MINDYQNNVGLRYHRNHFLSQKKEPIENENIEIDPVEVNTILNLHKQWKEAGEEHEETNSNFWVHHLETQLALNFKKHYGLFDFKQDEDKCVFGENEDNL